MATKQQKEELMATLKFTPRTYTISIWGYGGEIAVGTVPKATYDYLVENNIDIVDMADDWNDEVDIPNEHRFIQDGNWSEVDDIAHESGVEMDGGNNIEVSDENHAIVWEHGLDPTELNDDGTVTDEINLVDVNAQAPGTCMYIGRSVEKGTFYAGDIELTAPFNPKLLRITYGTVAGWSLLWGVTYNGVDINNDEYDTVGKSMDHELYVVSDTVDSEHNVSTQGG